MDFSDVSTVISLPVLVKITDNFSDKKSVGKGAYGEVYKVYICLSKLFFPRKLNIHGYGNC